MGIKGLDLLKGSCSTCFGMLKIRRNERAPWTPCPECTDQKE